MAERFRNHIDGEWREPESGEYFESRNPARLGDVIGEFPVSGPADVDRAVESAARGFEKWSQVPAPERGLIIQRAGNILRDRKDEIAREMTREMGKVLEETRGDVQEAIDTADYAAGEGRRLFGRTTPSELPDKWAMSYRRPIGVAGLITPFNFPVAIPSWKIFPALVCGNSVVFKPAEDVPHCGHLFVEVLLEAGVPEECVQLVHGGEEAGRSIVEHPDVPLVSFTGSTETGSRIAETCGRMNKRLSLEMGGKNAQAVMPDADVDLAMDGVVWGGFGTTGQRCTATSRLLLQREIHDEFVDRLVEEAGELELGDGLDESVDVGPLINQQAMDKVSRYMEIARDEGAEFACGGEPATGGELDDGHFFQPTVLTGVEPDMRVAREEIFGPVVSVIPFDDLDEAIAINNAVEYGLSSAIYTEDVRSAYRAIEEMDTGITYVNAPTIGAEVHLPFGGMKNTGNGHREGGWEVYEFYTETKVGYVDYSGRLQRAQIDVDWE
ncbi:MAG: aldehyde dehydrogenase family protein [Candidatus Palauibacterales bacterium]|nr:aldehyde dehydrogenase family protein [Candidatus Palauibacterales bacterium]